MEKEREEQGAHAAQQNGQGQTVQGKFVYTTTFSSLGRYVFGSEISYNKPPPRLPGLGC